MEGRSWNYLVQPFVKMQTSVLYYEQNNLTMNTGYFCKFLPSPIHVTRFLEQNFIIDHDHSLSKTRLKPVVISCFPLIRLTDFSTYWMQSKYY